MTKIKKQIYIVKDEITNMGDIVTFDLAFAKKYARALVKNYRDTVLKRDSILSERYPDHYAKMKKERIVSSGNRTCFRYWGRKAEVEEFEIFTSKTKKIC